MPHCTGYGSTISAADARCSGAMTALHLHYPHAAVRAACQARRESSGFLGLDDKHRVRTEDREAARADVEGGGGLVAARVVEVRPDDEDVLHVLRPGRLHRHRGGGRAV